MVPSSALPSGTVTFLFTDIEGSTRLWQDNPDAMYPALIRHDALIRDAITAQGGQVFKTVGDAFCAAFTVAPDALHAALDAQKAVLSEPWETGARLSVRIALHTGTAEQRQDYYFGPSLNRVSRLLSAAHGGQVLLSAATRTALPRQQTLRALIDCSYNLLNERERAALRALSIFTGGWTLPAAEAVCAGETVEDWEVLDLLSSLVDKSLVVYEFSDEDQARYRLLETVRQYGQDRLRESGEQDGARQRHATWFLALADQAAPQLRQSDQAAWLCSMENEHDNLRAALDWCLGRDETTETALRLCGSLWRFWEVHGHWTQGRAWFERALNAPGPVAPRWRARALCGAGFLASFQGDYARMAELASEGLTPAREIGDSRRAGAASVLLGFAAYAKGDLDQAAAFAAESLRLSREVEDKWQVCAALHLLGRAVMLQGDLERAFALQEECLGFMREIGEEAGLGYALWGLGEARQRQGQADAARGFFAESLLHFQTVGERRGMAHALEGLAKVAVDAGLAARLLGAAESLREEVGAAIEPADRIDRAQQAARIHSLLGEADFAASWAAGQAMPLDEVVALALAAPQ